MFWLVFPLVVVLLGPVWLDRWVARGSDGAVGSGQDSAVQVDDSALDTSGLVLKSEGTTGIPPHKY